MEIDTDVIKRTVYNDLGVLEKEMGELKATGDPSRLDETNELMILRAFASKLLKCLGGELTKSSFCNYLMKSKGFNYNDASGMWHRLLDSGFFDYIDGYVRTEFIDKGISQQLVKVLSEIRSIIKQIEEGNRKDAKHIKIEDMADWALEINQEVEKRLLKIGGKQDAVHDWRKWFSGKLEDFRSRNTKGG